MACGAGDISSLWTKRTSTWQVDTQSSTKGVQAWRHLTGETGLLKVTGLQRDISEF